MSSILKVILRDEEIGRLAWDNRRHTSYFTYNPDFVTKGLEVSPLKASIKSFGMGMPVWGESERLYQKLPAFLADSLPDAWGNQLFECWRRENRLSASDITPLEKLSFIGKRGMGALEFEPETGRKTTTDKVDIQSLVELSSRIFEQRENARILPEESLTLQSLISVGTSAGGRRPKAILAVNRETGEIRSGQVAGLDGYDYCILKFGDERYCSAELEMTYYEMASKAGIRMMPSRLIEVEGKRHFLTQRFDRNGDKKVHTQTLAAIWPEADSYEQLLWVCRKLRLPEGDLDEVFRRMVFNHLANNTDDHSKNFSFIMDEQGTWRLSPAYDMTYIIDINGYLPNHDHCIFTCGKLSSITFRDILDFAKTNGIRRPEKTIKEVANAINDFRTLATRHGVSTEWIGRIETCLQEHLADWGLSERKACIFSYTDKDGRTIENAHLEQALKGNIHLYATINGKEFKYVLRKNTADYQSILDHGLSHLTQEYMEILVEKYLINEKL